MPFSHPLGVSLYAEWVRMVIKLTKHTKSMIYFNEQTPAEKQNKYYYTPQKSRTNSLKTPEFKTKIYTFYGWFMSFLVRVMGLGK